MPRRPQKPTEPKRLRPRQLKELIEEALIDAYGESEQRVAFLTMLEEHLDCPFMTEILGTPVRVDGVDLNDPTKAAKGRRVFELHRLR